MMSLDTRDFTETPTQPNVPTLQQQKQICLPLCTLKFHPLCTFLTWSSLAFSNRCYYTIEHNFVFGIKSKSRSYIFCVPVYRHTVYFLSCQSGCTSYCPVGWRLVQHKWLCIDPVTHLQHPTNPSRGG